MSDLFVSVACLLRGLPLFFRAAPKTPLRVLCIVALDTLHVLRHSKPLSQKSAGELAMLLDFQACANAAWDDKALCTAEYQALRQRLETAGLGSCLDRYLVRLRDLETSRPPIGGDHRCFEDVRSYREAVARLALTTLTAVALDDDAFDDGLFAIAMQCQIIDDVVDYEEDLAAGLPSFLTACNSLPQAVELTATATRFYGSPSARSSAATVFPLRIALYAFTAVTKVVVRAAHRRHRIDRRALASAGQISRT